MSAGVSRCFQVDAQQRVVGSRVYVPLGSFMQAYAAWMLLNDLTLFAGWTGCSWVLSCGALCTHTDTGGLWEPILGLKLHCSSSGGACVRCSFLFCCHFHLWRQVCTDAAAAAAISSSTTAAHGTHTCGCHTCGHGLVTCHTLLHRCLCAASAFALMPSSRRFWEISKQYRLGYDAPPPVLHDFQGSPVLLHSSCAAGVAQHYHRPCT